MLNYKKSRKPNIPLAFVSVLRYILSTWYYVNHLLEEIVLSELSGVSFIGGGNMAGAIIDALLSSSILPPNKISVFDPSESKREVFKQKGINVANSNFELAQKNDILILAVKPQVIDSVLQELAGKLKNKCVVSIAAGISVEHIKSIIGNEIPIIRVLPNTPMLILEGMTVIAKAPEVSKDIFEFVVSIFEAAGEVVVLPESSINEAIPLSSSSPAFFFRMLKAMAISGSNTGISYDDAFKLAAVAMIGSAKYALKSDKSPTELINQVSSPGGTTVAALTAFDDFDFEAFINEVSSRCIKRAYELGNASKK